MVPKGRVGGAMSPTTPEEILEHMLQYSEEVQEQILASLLLVSETSEDREVWLPALRAAVRIGTEISGANRRRGP